MLVTRKICETGAFPRLKISLEIDGIHHVSGNTTGRYTLLSSKVIYVAGSPDPSILPGFGVAANFKGCLRKVRT